MKTMLVTGSGGLVGSCVAEYFLNRGWSVVGVDNNTRQDLFGTEGNVVDRYDNLRRYSNYTHVCEDLTRWQKVNEIYLNHKFDAVVHAAAQPSHDWAAKDPIRDFEINAIATCYMLNYARIHCPEAPFIYFSTSKVYGDHPNLLELYEQDDRYEIIDDQHPLGINENMSIDQCLHSLFGVSKASGDLLAQEYGRYYQMPTCILRPGCITGANHAGVKLHGFLNYLVKTAMDDDHYEILGYKGKQVRDNIHPFDLARFIEMFIANPKYGEVYNIGGGLDNSCSILEALDVIERISGKEVKYYYTDRPRIGDHICYYSDLRKVKRHYPEWDITIDLEAMIIEMINSFKAGL